VTGAVRDEPAAGAAAPSAAPRVAFQGDHGAYSEEAVGAWWGGAADPVPARECLDVAQAVAALDGPLPPPDRYESNDDAGMHAHTVFGQRADLKATLDYYDDQVDVYRLRLTRGQQLAVRLAGPSGSNTDLVLWKPGTERVNDLRSQRLRAAQSAHPGAVEQVSYRAPVTGWYFVEAKIISPGAGAYTLSFSKH
jgi:hypothetical protein